MTPSNANVLRQRPMHDNDNLNDKVDLILCNIVVTTVTVISSLKFCFVKTSTMKAIFVN